LQPRKENLQATEKRTQGGSDLPKEGICAPKKDGRYVVSPSTFPFGMEGALEGLLSRSKGGNQVQGARPFFLQRILCSRNSIALQKSLKRGENPVHPEMNLYEESPRKCSQLGVK